LPGAQGEQVAERYFPAARRVRAVAEKPGAACPAADFDPRAGALRRHEAERRHEGGGGGEALRGSGG
jgi:hypothetical protein